MVKKNNIIKRTIRKFERKSDSGKTVRAKDTLKWYKGKWDEINDVIYKTYVKEFYPMNISVTEILPGTIGKEYHMTKGHLHKSGKEEIYVLLEGSGKLLLQKKGKAKVVNLKIGEIALIEKGQAHRLINTGRKVMKVMTIYHSKSDPTYDVKFKKRFFKK